MEEDSLTVTADGAEFLAVESAGSGAVAELTVRGGGTGHAYVRNFRSASEVDCKTGACAVQECFYYSYLSVR